MISFSERENNARRIAALGAGEYLLPKSGRIGKKYVDLEEFRSKVKQLL